MTTTARTTCPPPLEGEGPGVGWEWGRRIERAAPLMRRSSHPEPRLSPTLDPPPLGEGNGRAEHRP